MIKNNQERLFFFIFFFSCFFVFLRLEIIFGSDTQAPFTDDFYYYLIPAKNLLKLGFPTFDTINLTNGFQPLWFLIILIIKFFINNEQIFNVIIFVIIFLLCVLTFLNFIKFLKLERFSHNETLFISTLISYLSFFFSRNGMEISLAIYLLSYSLIYYKKNYTIYSYLAFASFLARVDIIFIHFLLMLSHLFKNRKNLQIVFFELTLFPFLIIIYLIINFLIFDFPFPASGVAKSLYIELKFNTETFSFFYKNGLGFWLIKILFFFNLIGFFIISFFKPNFYTKIFFFSSVIYFLSNSLRSPWELWNWHFYYLAIVTSFITIEIIKIINKRQFLSILFIATNLFFLCSNIFLFKRDYGINNDHFINMANKITHYYNDKNYNSFAMGDMAGKIAYILNKPTIQLEGLISGSYILNEIKNQGSLCKIFDKFNVDIYLTSKINKINNSNEYLVFEPTINSKNVKRVYAKINGEPENIFTSGDLKVYAFNLKKNNICNAK